MRRQKSAYFTKSGPILTNVSALVDTYVGLQNLHKFHNGTRDVAMVTD